MEKLNMGSQTKIDKELAKNYKEASKNPDFKGLVDRIKVTENEAMRNTSKLEETLEELNHCKNCKGLFMCQNAYEGHVMFPEKKEDKLVFTYTPCKYQKKAIEAMDNKKTGSKELANARMKDIDIKDKNRVKLIKWIKNFYDNYDLSKSMKGLYLHGTFGSGKTFLLAALFNELNAKYGANTEMVYYPELLRNLKEDFNIVEDKISYLQSVDVLLLDDIGAENVTTWGRDEILGTILQSRMNDALPTFFTSNLNIEELERHLALTKNSEDVVKARRIVERIKQLTEDMELISVNRRQ
jgi:primosomal protein DnaI